MSAWPSRLLDCRRCGEPWEVFDCPAGYVDADSYYCPNCREHRHGSVSNEPLTAEARVAGSEPDEPRCHLCQHPGEDWCSDRVACNFRARRRLGIPVHACLEYRARDLETIAQGYRATAAEIAATGRRPMTAEYAAHIGSAAWQAFCDEQRLTAGFRCEWPTCRKVDGDLTVHHIHYDRFGQERPEDVLVLCPICHRDLDAKGREGLAPSAHVTVAGTCRVVTVELGLWVPRRWAFGRNKLRDGAA